VDKEVSRMPLYLSDAVTDAPVCTSFESYYLTFPNSKFIYTGPLNDWLESMRKYFLRRLGTGNFRKLKELMAGRDRLPHGGDLSNIHFASISITAISEGAYSAYDR
jgi:hypothetical protein